MKSCKIRKLLTYTTLLLSTVLLFGCKPIYEKKPIPGKEGESKEVAPEASSSAPSTGTPPEFVTRNEELEDLDSTLGDFTSENSQGTQTSATSELPAYVNDDGDDIIKPTPKIMRKIQQALVDAGFDPGPVDGVRGAKTIAAIESFQRRNNIPTGKLDKRTLRALDVDF